MRRLIHLMLSPSCRLARLVVAEKRVACDPVQAEDARNPMPVFIDLDETRVEGVWAIIDHLEANYPDHPLVPDDAAERRESLRWLDARPAWAISPWRRNCRCWTIWAKCRGPIFPPPPNGMCG